MTTQIAATTALVGYLVFLLLAFGLRSLLQFRRTGSTGFVGISGRVGSAEWWGGALFAVALVAGLGAPVLQLIDVVGPRTELADPRFHGVGMLLFTLGGGGTLWAQFAMGDAWRIGVDPESRTELVAVGPFRWVRNPIFTAMFVATCGLALLVPNAVALLAVVCLGVALEIQVRLVEEPYLSRTHGARYRRYAASAGRFLPGMGRLGEGQ